MKIIIYVLVPLVIVFFTYQWVKNKQDKAKRSKIAIYFIVWLLCLFSAGIVSGYLIFLYQSIVFTLAGALVGDTDKASNFKSFLYLVVPLFVTWNLTSMFLWVPHIIINTAAPPLGILLGFWLKQRYLNVGLLRTMPNLFISVLIIGATGVFVIPNWVSYLLVNNKKTFQTIPEYYSFSDKDGRQISMSDFKGKVVVLDFWTTSCGNCFKKFPRLNKAYHKMKNNKDMLLFAVNLPLRTDSSGDVKEVIAKYITPYHQFPVLISNVNYHDFDHNLVAGVPTVFVVDPDGKVRYKGDLYTSPNFWTYNVFRMAKNLLTEKK